MGNIPKLDLVVIDHGSIPVETDHRIVVRVGIHVVAARGGREEKEKAAFFAKKPWICTILSLQSKAVVVDIDLSPTTKDRRFALAPVAISPITPPWFRSNKACARGRMVRWVGSGVELPWTC